MIVNKVSICNSQKLEAIKMSLKKWTVKQTVVYPHQEIQLTNNKEET